MHSYDTLSTLPQRCRTAFDQARQSNVKAASIGIGSVYVIGAGEARLAARLVAAVLQSHAPIPVVNGSIGLGQALPPFVGRDTLVVLLSVDGSEPAEVALFGQAADTGASVMVVAPAGRLTDSAQDRAFPFAVAPASSNGAASLLGEVFFAGWGLLGALPSADRLLFAGGGGEDRAGAGSDAALATAWMTRQRTAFGPEARVETNPARLLTTALRGKMPLIYGTTPLAAEAAAVWADRLRRTGLPACARDMDVDAVAEGWPASPQIGTRAPLMEALVLREAHDAADNAIIQLRGALHPAGCNELVMEGRSPLERLWGAIHLAEWTAFYLAG